MNNRKTTGNSKDLEISIFTLWSLFVLIDQHYKALGKYRALLEKDYDFEKNEDGIYFDTIREALYYQILLKTCSFIEEWDEILGVKTETEYKNIILGIKKVAKPARKLLNTFKDLRRFRNQAIAHNHRDEKGNNIYRVKKKFHTPQNLADLALLVFAIEKMCKLLGAILYEEFQRAIMRPAKTELVNDHSNYKYFSKEEFINQIDAIDEQIRKSLKEENYSFTDVTSDYGELLRTAP